MGIPQQDLLNYARNSWLAGNRMEDCTAELLRYSVKRFGIVSESYICQLVSCVYEHLDRMLDHSASWMLNAFLNTRKHRNV